MDLHEAFKRHDEEYMEFSLVESPRSMRPDLHAFLLLDSLLPSDTDIISASKHDEFWLGIDCDKLAKVITDEQVRELVRCGVMYIEGDNALSMFS